MATYAFSGGVNQVAGWGQRDRVRFIGTWAIGETWKIQFTSTNGDFTLGRGNFAGAMHNFLMTYADRVYEANGASWNLSAIDDPTGWEEQNVGAGVVNFRTAIGITDSAVSLAVTQGRLAVFGRYNIQMWNIDADPDQFARVQILMNIGTVAPMSVQSVGELDVYFLDDTGIRSLRTRETTLNAFVDDIGNPVDSIVQGVLAGLTDAQKAVACAIVDPKSKRYWLHLNGVIYVLSNFRLSKIQAWSTYIPTYGKTYAASGASYGVDGTLTISGLTVGAKYEWVAGTNDYTITGGTFSLAASGEFIPDGTTAALTGKAGDSYTGVLNGQVAFTPEKFVVFQGKIYVRSTAGDLLIYGGTNGTTYDSTVATAELPWMDDGQPTLVKQGKGLDAAIKGPWHLYASMNPKSTTGMTEVISRGSSTAPDALQDSTFDSGHYPYSAAGTHFKFKGVSKAASVTAKIGKLSFLFDDANQK